MKNGGTAIHEDQIFQTHLTFHLVTLLILSVALVVGVVVDPQNPVTLVSTAVLPLFSRCLISQFVRHIFIVPSDVIQRPGSVCP
jgi:hypothetical protein